MYVLKARQCQGPPLPGCAIILGIRIFRPLHIFPDLRRVQQIGQGIGLNTSSRFFLNKRKCDDDYPKVQSIWLVIKD